MTYRGLMPSYTPFGNIGASVSASEFTHNSSLKIRISYLYEKEIISQEKEKTLLSQVGTNNNLIHDIITKLEDDNKLFENI